MGHVTRIFAMGLVSLMCAAPRVAMAVDPPEVHRAAVQGDVSHLEHLLARRAGSVDVRDRYGFTALHGAVGEHRLDVVAVLIAYGADVNARNDAGVTPLHLAAYPEMVETLVAHGADLEARDAAGATPLLTATGEPGRVAVVEALLRLGADVKATNGAGLAALDVAIACGDREKVDRLRRHGARRGGED